MLCLFLSFYYSEHEAVGSTEAKRRHVSEGRHTHTDPHDTTKSYLAVHFYPPQKFLLASFFEMQ